MARRPFKLNRRGLDQLYSSRGMGKGMQDAARIVADNVRNEAPVRTGYYRRSIGSQPAGDYDGVATAEVTTSDPFWHIIEYGSVDSPAYRPFRRGVEDSGLRFKDPGP